MALSMPLPRLLRQWVRRVKRRPTPTACRTARSARPRFDVLEDRTLLSTWVAAGPAPILNGQTPGGDAVTGRIAALAASPSDANTIYIAAAGGGVWKTTNAGNTWAPLTDNQTTLVMGAIALAPSNPNIIYAGTGEANNAGDSYYGRGVLVSADGGASWTLTGNSVFDRLAIGQIAVDPTDANTAYAAASDFTVNGRPFAGGTGIYKTTNGGTTWTNLTAAIDTFDPYSDVRIDPTNHNTVYMAIGDHFGDPYGTGGNGVYKSTDAGATWTKLSGGLPTSASTIGRIALALAPSNSQVIYASIAGTGNAGSTAHGSLFKMMKSTDGGTTWSQLTSTPNYLGSQGWYDTSLAVDPANASLVYAGGGGESIIRSLDGGSTWASISTGADGHGPHADHHGIGFDASGRLLDGNDGGLWRLNSGSPVQWADLNGNLQLTQFVGIALHPTSANIAYGGSQDNGTSKASSGTVWNLVRGGDGGHTRVDFANPQTVYHTYQYTVGFGFLERSDNGGTTWAAKTTGINTADPGNFYIPYVMDPANAARLLLGTNRVYETTNRGDGWSAISTPGSGGWTVSSAIDAIAATSDTNTVYASAGGHIFVTTNHGASWTDRSIPGVTDHIANLEADPANPQIAFAVRDRFSGGHVFRTTDGGATWTNISGNLPDLPAYTLALGSGVLYVGDDNGVFSSANGGATWQRDGTGLPNVQVHELAINTVTNTLGAGTYGRGLWTESLRTILTVNGTSGDDTITVHNLTGDPTSVEVIVNGASVFTGAWSSLGGIVIAASTGNDTINIENDAAGVPITVNLGNGSDVVNLSPTAHNLGNLMASVAINGGGGADTLNVNDQATATAQSWTVAGNSVTRGGAGPVSYGVISNLLVNGGGGNNTYTITDTQASLATTLNTGAGTDTVNVQGTTSALTINGGSGADTFNVSSTSGTAALTIAGGSGNNTLVGPNAASTWNITASNAGTLVFGSSTTTFSGIQNLTGGAAADTFVVSDGAGVSGTIDGGGGSNTLDESAYTTAVTVNLQTTVLNIQTLIGGSGINTLVGPNAATTWSVTAQNAGTLSGGISFTAFQNLTGGSAADTFILSDGAGVSGTIDGDGGSNTLDESAYTTPVTVNLQTNTATGVGGGFANLQNFIGSAGGGNTLVGPNVSPDPGAAVTWHVTANNAGTLSGGISFAAFQNLTGGSAPDRFVFADGAGVGGSIDGGGGFNTLNESAYTTAITIDLTANAATGVGGGFANLQSFIGGSGANTLLGPNADTTWNITANNAGTLTGGLSFSAFQNLTGGSGADTFVFADGAGVSGNIDGGTGTNALNYAAYSTNVIVNLQLNTATGVGGTVANIQNVTGGNGPGGYNILIGNGGNVLTGGNGRRNLLIAGAAASTLIGGDGEDILIAGTTDYDTNAAALQDIMSVWTGPGAYADRVNRLVNDPSYAFSLNAGTVHSNGGGNTLTGKPGGSTALDLYFANLGAGDTTDATSSDTTVGIL